MSSCPGAANALGLTTQLPLEQTFLALVRSEKRYDFGKQQITIRPAVAWNFLPADRPAGQAIRAWLAEVLSEQALEPQQARG